MESPFKVFACLSPSDSVDIIQELKIESREIESRSVIKDGKSAKTDLFSWFWRDCSKKFLFATPWVETTLEIVDSGKFLEFTCDIQLFLKKFLMRNLFKMFTIDPAITNLDTPFGEYAKKYVSPFSDDLRSVVVSTMVSTMVLRVANYECFGREPDVYGCFGQRLGCAREEHVISEFANKIQAKFVLEPCVTVLKNSDRAKIVFEVVQIFI